MKKELIEKIEKYFGCTPEELDDACWKSITNSNDYFHEGRGGICDIEVIEPYKELHIRSQKNRFNHDRALYEEYRIRKDKIFDEWQRQRFNYDNVGVFCYELNISIGYYMYNKNGTTCSTTVFWSSYNGGTLSHGTRSSGIIPFKCKCPKVIEVEFDIENSNGDSISTFPVCFGGYLPTLEERIKMIDFLIKRQNCKYSMKLVDKTDDSMFSRWNFRNKYDISCNKFIRQLFHGKYIPSGCTKSTKKIVKYSKLLGTSLDDTLIYKETYTDGTRKYVRVDNPNKK